MQHFYQTIDGRFTFEDIYLSAIAEAPTQCEFLELGCWQGKSTAFLATEIIKSGKDITLHVVDNFMWLNSGQFKSSNELKKEFYKNIRPVSDKIILWEQESANNIPNLYPWFVFVDAGHSYENVKKDIEAWYPKVWSGGVIAGHDYEKKYLGVRSAVAESFGFDYKVINKCWIHRKR